MCRLMAYMGPQILVADVVLWPSRSIIKQSYDARERRNDDSLPFHLSYGNLNGDGFGIGWYSSCSRQDSSPCTFTSVTPAWNNDNLNRLATKLESGLIFAHVRAAYSGMPVSEQNCHPFAHGDYLFMHNGVVAGFMDIRRRLLSELSDEAYNCVQSFHSDSAVCFGIFLHHLPSMTEKQPAETLLRAMQATIATISRIQHEAGITDTSLLNFVVSDGKTMVATRYVSNDEQPASLYFAEGSAYQRTGGSIDAPKAAARAASASAALRSAGGSAGAAGARSGAVTGESDYRLTYSGTDARVCLIASEPVTSEASEWTEVPRNTALVVCREKDGILTVVQVPLTASGEHPKHDEIHRCIEAITGAADIMARVSALQLSSSVSPQTVNPPSLLSEPSGGAFIKREGGFNTSSVDEITPRSDSLPSSYHVDSSFLSMPHLDHNSMGSRTQHFLTGHDGPVTALCAHAGLLFSGSTDTTVKVWSLRECLCLRTLTGHRHPIRRLTIAGGVLLSAGAKTVRLWSLSDFACVSVLQASDVRGSIKALEAATEGTVYVGGQDCAVKAFSKEDVAGAGLADSPRCMARGETARTCMGTAQEPTRASDSAHTHCASVLCLALCGDYVCSGASDSTVRVWRQTTLEFVKTLRGHRGSVLALHAVGGLLLSGGRDHLIRAWDIETWVCRKTLRGHTNDVLHIASIPTLHTHGDCGAGALAFERAFTLSSFPSSGPILEPGSPLSSPGESPYFASSSADGTIRLWNGKTFSCIHVFAACSGVPLGRPTNVLSCALTPSYAIGAFDDGSITMYQAEDIFAAEDAKQEESVAGLHLECAVPAGASRADRNGGGGCNAHKDGSRGDDGNRLEREFERALRIFTRYKTVSADPALKEDCFRGAKFLLRLLESMGAEVKLTQPVEGKNPVVLGRILADSSLPTVTCYGHYDVQPALEPEWTSPPFEMTSVDGYLYGRGVSDNKGPILAFVYAIKELLQDNSNCRGVRGLPVNVTFLFEGEEENGSIGFRDAVQQNLRWFEGTRAILISNTLWVGEERPCITYGMRGMITLSVEVRGPAKDLHSGNEGGVFSEPLSDLSKVLASLVDSRNNICVPGFYSGVRPNMLSAALQRLRTSSEFSLDGYRTTLGVKELTAGRSEEELLTARWCQPSLSVVDVRVGTAEDADTAHYRFGPTRFSVIPRAAVGKVSVRFVPDQDAEELMDLLTAHMKHEFAKLRSGNSIRVRQHSVGDWWEACPSSVLIKMTEAAVEAEWGEVPLLVREGGTMPVASTLEKMLNAPAVLLPLGQSSDCCHLANERIRRVNLMRGKDVIKQILLAMGEVKSVL